MNPGSLAARPALLKPATTELGRWMDGVCDRNAWTGAHLARQAGIGVREVCLVRRGKRPAGKRMLRLLLALPDLDERDKVACVAAWGKDLLRELREEEEWRARHDAVLESTLGTGATK